MGDIRVAISVLGADIFESSTGHIVKAKRIAKVLKKIYDVTLIARANKKRWNRDIITVIPAGTKLWNLKLIPIIMKERFNCIYCMGDIFGFMSYYMLSRKFGYKIIFEPFTICSELTKKKDSWIKGKFYKILEEFVVRHADHVVVEAEYILRFYKRFNENITLLPLFIDTDLFKRDRGDDSGETEKVKKVGLIGPFNLPHNRYYLDFFYNNFNRFDNRIIFVLIGRCDYRIKNERIMYTGYLTSLGDYINQLCSLDAVLLVHKPLDPGPYTKIMESMACSLPVFTTPQGLIGMEYAKPGRDILVFREDELVHKFNELIFDNELMKAVGRNAKTVIEKYYSEGVNEKKLIKIIEKLCDVS